MDLWVRSQDREYLEKIEKIYVWEAAHEDYRIEGKSELGTYKTQKRALEVLDEIERPIKCICVVRDSEEDVLKSILKVEDTRKFMAENLYIYHMPEE